VTDELAVALHSGEGGAGEDDESHAEPGYVLCPFVAIREASAGTLLGDGEPDGHHGAGRDVGEVVQGVAEEAHRVGEKGEDQLDPTRGRQPDRGYAYGPDGGPAVLGLVMRSRLGVGVM